MAFLSPKLPLERDVTEGYGMNSELSEVFRQNFKNLLLTSPGERIMDPRFGVGLRNYLFEQNAYSLDQDVKSKINEQVQIYLPFLKVSTVNITYDDTELLLSIEVRYHVPALNITDRVTIDNSTVRNTEFQTI